MNRNPFATRYTSPGKIPYLAGAEFTATDMLCASLHQQWQEWGRMGAISGPHGCGKSTLLAALTHHWSRAYALRITLITLRDGQRALPGWLWQREFQAHDLLLVDGYEQLNWHARWRLNRLLRNFGCGLLVTTHIACQLPTLYRIEPNYEMLLAVVQQLVKPFGRPEQMGDFVQRHFRHAWSQTLGNARETLFRLYDRWEEESLFHFELSGCSGPHNASESVALEVSSN